VVASLEAPAVKAVVYTRVSTAEQAAGGISLDMQAQHAGRLCLGRSWDLEEVYSDPGHSGAEWAKRPGLQRLLRRLTAADPPGALVVYRLDRVGRKARYIHRLLETLERSGTVFISTSEPQFDTSTPMGRAMLGMAAVFAEFERDTIVERVSDAMLAIAKEGRWTGGHPPFGYDYIPGADGEPGRLVPNADAPLVRLAFTLYAEDRVGLMPIARRLAAASGQRWTPGRVAKLLERRTYEGLVPHNGTHYPGQHEAILEPELAARVREVHALRRARFPYGERVRYLLSGILRCRHCGAAMVCAVSTQRGDRPNVPVYRCSARVVSYGDSQRCRGSYIRTAKAERLLLAFLHGSGAPAAVGAVEDPATPTVESPEEESIRRQLGALPGRRERLVGYASRGTITEEDLTVALTGMEAEEEELRRALDEVRRPARMGKGKMRRLFRDVAAVLASEEVELQRKRDLLLATFSALVVTPAGEIHFRLAR
jgi:site-specific DNA recombinase